MGPADDILTALDRVHRAVRAGRYADLEGLTEELETAMRALPGVAAASLETLRRKAERNAACLGASILGLRSARRRIVEILDMQDGKGTYDSRGRRDALALATGRLSARL